MLQPHARSTGSASLSPTCTIRLACQYLTHLAFPPSESFLESIVFHSSLLDATMSSTTSVPSDRSTITSPMSTIYTPPSSCSSHWTYEAPTANSVSGGLLLQDAQYDQPDEPCFPSGFEGWGRAPSFIQIFSPGACPIGYTTANNNYVDKTTIAICCLRYSLAP